MGFAGQLKLLLWKNYVLQKRKVCVTVFEILLPVFFALLLLFIRSRVDVTPIDTASVWASFDVELNASDRANRSHYIVYSPNQSEINNLMNMMQSNFDPGSGKAFKGFQSEDDILSYHSANPRNIWAAVVFDDSQDYSVSLPNNIKYSLRVARLKATDSWRTNRVYPFFQRIGYRNDDQKGGTPNYYETGFLELKLRVDEAIINYTSASPVDFSNVNISLKKMPYPKFVKDDLLPVIQGNLPLFLMLAFILSTLQLVKGIVYEKEKRLKESMKMMGLRTSVYWLSWFIKAMIYLMLSCLFFGVFLSIKLGDKGAVLNNSHPTLIYVFLLCYSVSIVAFAFMISSFFTSANVGATAAFILFLLTYIPYFFLQSRYETMSIDEKILACLLSNVAMAFGVNTFGLYEGTTAGAQWWNFYKPASIDDNFSLLFAMLMLLGDSLLYFLIAWYVDNVRPGAYGVPKPFYFLFTKSYWFGTSPSTDDYSDLHIHEESKLFEREPTDLKVGISIKKLRKVFGSGKQKKTAVAGTSLNVYEGQITALLGHNGAGKTTTMSMLTGFIPPTSGTATVNGYDIRKDIAGVRNSLGLCPQHNILFDTMTVTEHLDFFASLKGCPKSAIKQEVENMIVTLGLETKRDSFSSTLSGGQKRKLSVGIALIGGSKTIILDEPTSGMDPAARRQTWDILQKFRKGRVMILSTHFMDEADLLGDRIAIMAEGVVKCCGTSLFLKKTFGAGYHLVIVKNSSCNVPNLTLAIQNHIPSAILESEISAELSYLLPFEESSKFEDLFIDIESRSSQLGISSFGASATTMEEVFFKVGEHGSDEGSGDSPLSFENLGYEDKAMNGRDHSLKKGIETANGTSAGIPMKNITNAGKFIEFNNDLKRNTGFSLAMQQFFGMFIKKIIHTGRNRIVTAVQLTIPVIFTIIALSIEKALPKVKDEPAMTLDLERFQSNIVVPFVADRQTNNISNVFSRAVKSYGYKVENDSLSPKTFDDILLDKMDTIGLSDFNREYIIGADFGSVSGETSILGYFNGQPYHSPAIALSYILDTLYKYYLGSSYSITTVNFPLPKSLSDQNTVLNASVNGTGFTIAFLVLLGMAFLTTSFIIFLIKERNSGAKHLQVVSGVSSFSFWFSSLLWDFLNYIIPVLALLIVFTAFQTNAYTDDNRLGLILLLLVVYGWAVLPFVYLLHYLFKTPASGMVAVSMLNIITGLATLMAVFILRIPSLNTKVIGDALDWIFTTVVPNYCMGQGLMNMYSNYEFTKRCEKISILCMYLPPNVLNPCCKGRCGDTCIEFNENYLAWELPGIGRYLIFMAIQGLVYLFLLFLIESGVINQFIYCMKGQNNISVGFETGMYEKVVEEQEDDDVSAERKRITNTPLENLLETDSLVIQGLSKQYGGYKAVDNISFGISNQECFGLLGQNGAGKTSTFKMLTGDLTVTSGNAYLHVYDIKQHLKQVQQNMGYCPQFDALIDQMTGRETLTMYARLRGVTEHQIKHVVNELLDVMTLRKYADKQCGQYSGGNKRKLSTAIALIGDPLFVLLDEPTTGMDPTARRQLWNVLSQIRESGRTLILTSHSMEECDALCTKIVIMVNGKFVCLGSPQHLKNKFGHGYTLVVRLGSEAPGVPIQMDPLKEYVMTTFPNSRIFDDHQGYLHFQIPDADVPLARVFGAMEKAKNLFKIEDYSVHQTTLEQIFLSFTRHQIVASTTKVKTSNSLCCCFSCCS